MLSMLPMLLMLPMLSVLSVAGASRTPALPRGVPRVAVCCCGVGGGRETCRLTAEARRPSNG